MIIMIKFMFNIFSVLGEVLQVAGSLMVFFLIYCELTLNRFKLFGAFSYYSGGLAGGTGGKKI